jgi:poly(A) polymerase
VMTILGIPPGRDVGQAMAFLLELRLERGPMGEEAATQALVQWWASRT